MNRSIRLLAATLVAVVAPLAAHADQVADVKAKGELVCGVLGTDDPFSFVDPKSREIVGYEVDLCNAIAKKLGVKASLKQLAVAARVPELQQGRVDILAASLTHNKEREALIDFSLSTFVTGQKVMTKKASGITEPSQLGGKKVLTVKGSTMEQNIKKAVPAAEIVSFDNSPQAFLALQQGKGVAYVNDETSLIDDFSKLGPAQKDYVILPASISTEHLALGLKKGETGMKTLVDGVLRDMEKSGEADKLFAKWFGPDTKMKFPSRPFKYETDKID
jgi:polar amino acid transport system substrate-binding protein